MTQSGWKRKFIAIAAGQAVSLIGSAAVQFSLIWWIASETNSPIMLGLSGLAAYLPALFLSPLAGVLADRLNRKLICILSDMFVGLSALVFALFMWKSEVASGMALVVLFVRGISGTFQQPAIQAIIPQLVPPQELVMANGWTQFMQSGAFMIGPVLGAAMYAALPMPVILLTDLVGAIVASVMLGMVPIPKLTVVAPKRQQFLREWRDGLQIYLEDRTLMNIMVVQALCMLFYLPLSAFYPLMTSSYFKASAWHGSIVELSYAAGMMLSAVLFGSVIKVNNKIRVAYIGLLGIGTASLVGGILPPTVFGWWVFMIDCGLLGGFSNVYGIPLMAYMQETIPQEKMGRAFSLLGMISSAAMPLGLFFASPVAEAIGVNIWFAITGMAVILIALIGGIALRTMVHRGNL